MRRRYSCQSWNVAAKVVIYPSDDDEFVTAREDTDQTLTESESLETCLEDISENTEQIVESISETLGRRPSKY